MKTDKEYVDFLKLQYPKGTRILLHFMGKDPHPIEPNTKGTVLHVDDLGTIHCSFDNGRRLGLIHGEDSFEILRNKIYDYER